MQFVCVCVCTTTVDPSIPSRHTLNPIFQQRICFAKGKSDATALRDGSYEPKAKRQKREAKERARVRPPVGVVC